MANGGFEKDRNTLKKLCPAKQYTITCQGQEAYPVAQGLRILLITKIEESLRRLIVQATSGKKNMTNVPVWNE
jgi:hypothetical protein